MEETKTIKQLESGLDKDIDKAMKMAKQTSDIYLAAVLLALGANLDDTDRNDPRHMVFHFSSEELDFDDIEKQWTNKTLMINAVDFKVAIQQMKSVIYAY